MIHPKRSLGCNDRSTHCKVYAENATLPIHLWNNFQSIDYKFFSEEASEIPPFPNVKDLHLRINLWIPWYC